MEGLLPETRGPPSALLPRAPNYLPASAELKPAAPPPGDKGPTKRLVAACTQLPPRFRRAQACRAGRVATAGTEGEREGRPRREHIRCHRPPQTAPAAGARDRRTSRHSPPLANLPWPTE
jgi:hypothetical protein